MLKPYDHSELLCGVNESVKDYGKLYLARLEAKADDMEMSATDILKRVFFEDSVCVKKCPTSN